MTNALHRCDRDLERTLCRQVLLRRFTNRDHPGLLFLWSVDIDLRGLFRADDLERILGRIWVFYSNDRAVLEADLSMERERVLKRVHAGARPEDAV